LRCAQHARVLKNIPLMKDQRRWQEGQKYVERPP
jgi:hypothetical protein